MTTNTSYHSLLLNFKSIVEWVTKFPTLPYGAFERIRLTIFPILFHGLKQTDENPSDQFWQMILRLNSSSDQYLHLFREIYHANDLPLTIEQWIDQSILNQYLAEQLINMTNQIDLLEQYYQSDAFIRMHDFYQALIICIRSIESNEPSLLANIDPNLSIRSLEPSKTITNDFIGRSYSSIIPLRRNDQIHQSIDDEQINSSLRRRVNSDPTHQSDKKSTEFSISYLLHDVQSNLSYSIDDNSSCDAHPDCYLSIDPLVSNEIQSIDKDEEQEIKPMNIFDSWNSPPLPHSSVLWPRKGQRLDHYIRECDSQTLTDLDKDNAHFYLSEAILTAVEYVKFSEECRKYFHPSIDALTQIQTSVNQFEKNGNDSHDLSAERIALTIMETWKNYQIPTALDLFWMIPHENEIDDEVTRGWRSGTIDQNASERLNNGNEKILQRGNEQWAPLREQLIFHIHQPINRDIQLKNQANRCPGCGRTVEKGYPHRFRYCEYTGKYFCRSCHSEKRFYLPSYIITKWDFSNRHSISNFADEYLHRIFDKPIFNLYDLNPKLYERSTKLRAMNELRWALYSLKFYIIACRFAEEHGHRQSLLNIPSYIYEQPHVYSLEDLVKLKSRELQKIYEPIVHKLRDHVFACSLCYARGFICEICNNSSKIIFPFDIANTSVCPVCQSCFHLQCHKTYKYLCPKCQRNQHRNTLSAQ